MTLLPLSQSWLPHFLVASPSVSSVSPSLCGGHQTSPLSGLHHSSLATSTVSAGPKFTSIAASDPEIIANVVFLSGGHFKIQYDGRYFTIPSGNGYHLNPCPPKHTLRYQNQVNSLLMFIDSSKCRFQEAAILKFNMAAGSWQYQVAIGTIWFLAPQNLHLDTRIKSIAALCW